MLAPVPHGVVTAFTALRQVASALGVRRPSSDDVRRRAACLEEADQRLALFGWPHARAYRVYSAGDSSCGREEILFVARHGAPFTARLGTAMAAGRRVEWVDVEEGW